MENKKIDFFYYFMIFIVVVVLLVGVSFIKSESRKCLKQPFIYGAEKLGGVECNCNKPLSFMCMQRIYFNESTFLIDINNECKPRSRPDLSLFNLTP